MILTFPPYYWPEKRASQEAQQNDPEGIFVDVGANIGACTLLMAAYGHKTVGFEPSSANFFYLVSSVLANPKKIRDNIVLYQMGLGKERAFANAYVANGTLSCNEN
jgi:FkbM family methyltransferase